MALKLTDISELGPATFAGDVTIADSKKLYLGGGNDLRIYHVEDSNSYIEEHGAGALVFKSNDFYFQSTASATALQITPGGAVTVSGGNLTLGGTGRIQGIDTVSASTDAANKTYVDTQVAGIVDSAPGTLNTLNELAAALGDDASFSTTVTNSIAAKLPLAGGNITGATTIRYDQGASDNAILRLRGQNTTNRITRFQLEDYSGALADALIQFRVPTAGTASSAVLELGVNAAGLTLAHGHAATFAGRLAVGGAAQNTNSGILDVKLTQTSGALSGTSAAHFGTTGHTSGNIMGITLGYKEDGNTAYRKVALVAAGRGDNAARQDFHVLVDIANDSGSAVIGDSKLKIDGLTGDITFPNKVKIGTGTSYLVQSGNGLQIKTGSTSQYTSEFHQDGPLYTQKIIDIGDSNYYLDPNATSRLNTILNNDGSASSPVYSFAADTDTGIYRNTTNQMTLVAAGDNVGTIHSGGIQMHNNDIDYVHQLHFNDNVRFYDDGNDSYLNFKFGDTGSGGIKFYDGSGNLHGYFYADGDDSIGILDSGGSWAVQVDNDVITALKVNDTYRVKATTTGVELIGAITINGTITGNVTANQFVDAQDTAFYANPAATSILRRTVGTRRNLATSEAWSETNAWSVGTQTGYFGGSFTINGAADENNIAYEIGPGTTHASGHGNRCLVWKIKTNATDSNADGGWNKTITNINVNMGHMSVVYVKRVGNGNGNFYHGTSTCLNLSDGGSNGNPYFYGSSAQSLPSGVWCVSIGYLQANNDTAVTASSSFSGIYRLDTGERILGCTDYRMSGGTTTTQHRAFLYYATNTSTELWMTKPGFYEINGSEPTINELLMRPEDRVDSLRADGDMRAPILYDSDQTSYYCNPSSTGNFNAGTFAGLITGNNNIQLGGSNKTLHLLYNNTASYRGNLGWSYLQMGNNGWNDIIAGNTSAGAGMQFYTNNSNDCAADTAPNGTLVLQMASDGNATFQSTLFANASMRTPIFYDKDNTAYYLSPNTLSKLNYAAVGVNSAGIANVEYGNLRVSSNGSGETTMGDGSIAVQLGPSTTRAGTSAPFYGGITWNGLMNYNAGNGYDENPHVWVGAKYHDTPGSERSYFVVGVKSATGTGSSDIPVQRFSIDYSGHAIATGSLRAPVFYDNDNTAYYLNPAGTSNIGGAIAMTNNSITGVGSIALNNGFTLNQGSSTYAQLSSWIDVLAVGLYSSNVNSAHIYPNQLSDYGTWRIDGSRNGWNGIMFVNGSHHNTLMGCGADGRMGLYNDTDNEWFLECNKGGSVMLYYNAAVKLATSNTGVTVTGTLLVNADGDSSLSIIDGGTNAIQIYGNTGDELYLGSNGASKMRIHSGGAIEATVGDFRAPIFYDTNNTAFYTDPLSTSVMWGIKDDHGNEYISKYHSASDFADGTLVVTDITSNTTNGDSFVLEATGKSYSANPPFSFMAQGYLYNSTIINHSGVHNGHAGFTTMKAFDHSGSLAFWWPRVSYWNSFEVRVRNANGANTARNRVVSISNATEPSSSKKVTIAMSTSVRYGSSTNAGNLYGTTFYDADNTAYYTNPHDTTNLKHLSLLAAGNLQQYESDNGSFIHTDARAEGTHSAAYKYSHNGSSYGAYREYWYDSSAYSNIVISGGRFTFSAPITTATDIRSEIFYDSNDSSYYVNPNSTSVVNNLTLAGTLAHTGSLIIDATSQISIDAGNSEIHLRGSGTTFGKLFTSGGNFYINHPTSDADIYITGNDGGSSINALVFDMSNGGKATFNNDVLAFSDRKLKKNIKTLDGSKVYDMRGVSFTRKDTGKDGSGIIAQELQKIAPELVSETDGTLGIAYGNVTGYLIEAIKELKTEIEELKNHKCDGCTK